MKQALSPSRHERFFQVDFVRRYPISAWIIVKKTLRSFLAFAGVAIFALLVFTAPEFLNLELTDRAEFGLKVLLLTLAGIWICRVFYEALHRLSYYYGVEDGHLVLVRGVFLRKRGVFPLTRITDVYLERSVLDFIFGHYTLHFATPTLLSEQFARIDGLTHLAALSIQHELTGLLENAEARNRSNANERQYLRPSMPDLNAWEGGVQVAA